MQHALLGSFVFGRSQGIGVQQQGIPGEVFILEGHVFLQQRHLLGLAPDGLLRFCDIVFDQFLFLNRKIGLQVMIEQKTLLYELNIIGLQFPEGAVFVQKISGKVKFPPVSVPQQRIFQFQYRTVITCVIQYGDHLVLCNGIPILYQNMFDLVGRTGDQIRRRV